MKKALPFLVALAAAIGVLFVVMRRKALAATTRVLPSDPLKPDYLPPSAPPAVNIPAVPAAIAAVRGIPFSPVGSLSAVVTSVKGPLPIVGAAFSSVGKALGGEVKKLGISIPFKPAAPRPSNNVAPSPPKSTSPIGKVTAGLKKISFR